MVTVDITKKRVIDFDPKICRLKDDCILVFSPLDLMEDNNLFLPEGIRMPNGEISDKISFDDWSFFVTLSQNLAVFNKFRKYMQLAQNLECAFRQFAQSFTFC